jgi:hypothetical protein
MQALLHFFSDFFLFYRQDGKQYSLTHHKYAINYLKLEFDLKKW